MDTLGPVFCCALEPKNGNLVVTGGQDDMAYVWEIHNGQILFECTGHKVSFTLMSSWNLSLLEMLSLCAALCCPNTATVYWISLIPGKHSCSALYLTCFYCPTLLCLLNARFQKIKNLLKVILLVKYNHSIVKIEVIIF